MERIIIKGEIYDKSKFISLYNDGQWSDSGYEFFLAGERDGEPILIQYNWSKWQGQESTYDFISLDELVSHLLDIEDEDHSYRALDGLEKLSKYIDLTEYEADINYYAE